MSHLLSFLLKNCPVSFRTFGSILLEDNMMIKTNNKYVKYLATYCGDVHKNFDDVAVCVSMNASNYSGISHHSLLVKITINSSCASCQRGSNKYTYNNT